MSYEKLPFDLRSRERNFLFLIAPPRYLTLPCRYPSISISLVLCVSLRSPSPLKNLKVGWPNLLQLNLQKRQNWTLKMLLLKTETERRKVHSGTLTSSTAHTAFNLIAKDVTLFIGHTCVICKFVHDVQNSCNIFRLAGDDPQRLQDRPGNLLPKEKMDKYWVVLFVV